MALDSFYRYAYDVSHERDEKTGQVVKGFFYTNPERDSADYGCVSHYTLNLFIKYFVATKWFERVTPKKTRKPDGKFASIAYRVLSHEEFVAKYGPKLCRYKADIHKAMVAAETKRRTGTGKTHAPFQPDKPLKDKNLLGGEEEKQITTPSYKAWATPNYKVPSTPSYKAEDSNRDRIREGELNAKRLDASLPSEQAGQVVKVSSLSELDSNYLPLADWKQVVQDLTSERVFFPEDHHKRYRQLMEEYGPEAIISALKEFCIHETNPTFKYRLFSANFLAAAPVILAAKEIGFTERKTL